MCVIFNLELWGFKKAEKGNKLQRANNPLKAHRLFSVDMF